MLRDPVAFQISDREFHTVIYAACSNALLRDFVSDMYDYALDYRRQALTRKGAITQSVEDHERIVEALATRDPGRPRRRSAATCRTCTPPRAARWRADPAMTSRPRGR